MAGKRMSPKAQSDDRMSRADSLASIAKYGRVVSPSQAVKASAKPKGGSRNPFAKLIGALGGKKK